MEQVVQPKQVQQNEEEKVITFKVENKIYSVLESDIPKGSLLETMVKDKHFKNRIDKEENIVIEELTEEAAEIIFGYINKQIEPKVEYIEIFDYFQIDYKESYELSKLQEEYMREFMYDSNYKDDAMNKDNYYGLVKITKESWEKLEIKERLDDNLLFNKKILKKASWMKIQQRLATLKKIMSLPNLFLAGGAIFAILFGYKINDHDLFLYGCTYEQAKKQIFLFEQILKQNKNSNIFAGFKDNYLVDLIWDYIKKNKKEGNSNIFKKLSSFLNEFKETYGKDCKTKENVKEKFKEMMGLDNDILMRPMGNYFSVTRSANSITFASPREQYQFVLRLYRTPSEIIHGFDVDCCCMGYDGKDIWMTKRALFSIINGYNTVNFDRLSPSYEGRLAKYGLRGVATKIPNFNKDKINIDQLIKFRETSSKTDHQQKKKHLRVKQLKGLDILLYFDFYYNDKERRNFSRSLVKYNKENSDYSITPFCLYGPGTDGIALYSILNYLKNSYNNYPYHSSKYLPYLNDIFSDKNINTYNNYLTLYTNHFLLTKEIFLIKTVKQTTGLNEIWEIPEAIYNCLGEIRFWSIPRITTFKKTEPGAQMTNTFIKLTLQDNNTYYKGLFYQQ